MKGKETDTRVRKTVRNYGPLRIEVRQVSSKGRFISPEEDLTAEEGTREIRIALGALGVTFKMATEVSREEIRFSPNNPNSR